MVEGASRECVRVYPDSEGRPEGDTDDANGTNEPCEP